MNSLMEYKGYHAAIEYSAEDHAMIGQIIGINDVLAFDAENVDELEAMFHETIDDYLEMCARTGKDPDKEYKGSFNIRIGSELHKKADLQAKAQHTRFNTVLAAQRFDIFVYSIQKDTSVIGCINKSTFFENKHLNSFDFETIIELQHSKRALKCGSLNSYYSAQKGTVKKKSLPPSSSRL